jgi:hypothetical protein
MRAQRRLENSMARLRDDERRRPPGHFPAAARARGRELFHEFVPGGTPVVEVSGCPPQRPTPSSASFRRSSCAISRFPSGV